MAAVPNVHCECHDDEDNGGIASPGLNVGQLRAALDGMDDSLPVMVTTRSGEFCGGIIGASREVNCGGCTFVIDCSDDLKDFDGATATP